LKSQIDCSQCGYEYPIIHTVDGICTHCIEQNKYYDDLLKDQKEHPEKLLAKWGVPKKHVNSSFANYQDGDKIKEYLLDASKKKQDILLYGKTGCGKTHLAVAMLRGRIERASKPFNPHSYGSNQKTIFMPVPELLFEIRQTFNNKDNGDTEATIIDKYSNAGLLILDDLGAEKTTEWAESILYLIIDRRNRDKMWTIITSNLSLAEIEQSLGARIASRLADMKVINIKLPDYRKKREQQKAVGL
jgi:DNA replication protein DnaC